MLLRPKTLLAALSLAGSVMAADNMIPAGKMLDKSTFSDSIAKDYWLVFFFSPYCPHCRSFKPMWGEFVEKESKVPGLHFASVNCIEQGDLCKDAEVRSYPWLQLYYNGLKKAKFDGARSLPRLHEWIGENVGTAAPKVEGLPPPPPGEHAHHHEHDHEHEHGHHHDHDHEHGRHPDHDHEHGHHPGHDHDHDREHHHPPHDHDHEHGNDHGHIDHHDHKPEQIPAPPGLKDTPEPVEQGTLPPLPTNTVDLLMRPDVAFGVGILILLVLFVFRRRLRRWSRTAGDFSNDAEKGSTRSFKD